LLRIEDLAFIVDELIEEREAIASQDAKPEPGEDRLEADISSIDPPTDA